MTATKTVVKTAAKPAAKSVSKPKAAAKPKTEVKTLFYASLLADALAGKYGATLQRFYVSACQYHLKAKTVFPRARNVGEALLKPEDAVVFLKKHEVTSIPAGSKMGQRLYDAMMAETQVK